jgi:hypothetical protein
MNPPDFSRLGIVTEGVWGSWAVFGGGGLYRYMLHRAWQRGTLAVWIMLNPSTADARFDDPTIRKVTGFTQRLGHAGFIVVNLFGRRATDPRKLRDAGDQVGPANANMLRAALRYSDTRIAAWGRFPSRAERELAQPLRALVMQASPMCFGRTADNEPRHPLMLAYDTTFERFDGAIATQVTR